MALRVLLADESVTIKKVFQLSLQDYGAEVLTVSAGLDVVPVARKNKPDIIFADVLLQKKSGYDVAAEIKRDPELKNVPVVLIWNGFMEFDEARYKASGANDHLEKPFDTQKLRQIVQALVPKTQNQKLADFLQFPRLPDFTEAAKPAAPPLTQAPAAPPPAQAAPPPASWNMDSFEPLAVPEDEVDEFVPVELPPPAPVTKSQFVAPVADEPEVEEGENQWIQKTLSNYKVPAPALDEDEDENAAQIPIVRNEVTVTRNVPTSAVADDDGEIELDLSGEPLRPTASPVAPMTEKQLEAIIRAQSKEMIEKVIWQVVPEIASQIIEREIQKLLKERDELGPR
jgi:CheY-like chemotaxis protein